jgi:hypothetical protein
MSKRTLEQVVKGLSERQAPPSPLLVSEDPTSGVWHDGEGMVYEKSGVDPVAVIPEPIGRPTEDAPTDQ